MNAHLHFRTPVLNVIDNRGLPIRQVTYWRSDTVASNPESRIVTQRYDGAGHRVEQRDARLTKPTDRANLIRRCSLSGIELLVDSVDAGWRVAGYDGAGLLCDSWDGREIHRSYNYDEIMRPQSVFEHVAQQCVERFTYAGLNEEDIRNNRCGKLLRHDDQAGSLWHESFGLTARPLTEKRRFFKLLTPPCWPESEADLEDITYVTRWSYDALGGVVAQVDALGHVQRFGVDISGRPNACWLNGMALLKSTTYNACGEVEIEQVGNGITSRASYSPVDGRLYSLKAEKSDGKTLQHLYCLYDPVGNIECIEDLSQPVQWFAKQHIKAVGTYTYDSLYQLTSATGRENASQIIGPGLPGLEISGVRDESRWRNYTQTYTYDSGGNLTRLKHDAGPGNVYNRVFVVDERSNRSLFNDGLPTDFAKDFDVNGNQLTLAPGQKMKWNARNQLHQVTQVQRDESDGQDDDVETYVYDGGSQRVRKVRRAKTCGGERVSEVRYLPGLEIRTRTASEQLHVVIARAGRNGVRLLHWERGLRQGLENDQLRYSLCDHLGSSTLELNERAELISQESHYPYGGTAWWASKSALEAKYKTVRYSGKERDATGLYYYGFRYYAPWLQRWINPDPAGEVDGLNLFRMVRNNPVSLKDADGRQSDFNKLFKPEKGDLIFGLAKVLDTGYLSWRAALTGRGDYLAKYLSGDRIAALETELNGWRDSYSSIRDSTWFMASSATNQGLWEGQYEPIAELVFRAEDKYYADIKNRYSGAFATAANTNFAQRYVTEMSSGRYSIRSTFEHYLEASTFGDKLISRASKAGLVTVLNSGRDDVIHFTLDKLDMKQVVLKTRNSATSSELRYLYRHRLKLADKVLFYMKGKLVDAPWRTDRALWNRYQPKRAVSTVNSARH